ncbi:MAG: hypothetical protein HKM07_07695 [Chlamydiae bacterium]|jgi:type III secretion protein W|nr:hypothetical protein [Chlamydiota bacterium]
MSDPNPLSISNIGGITPIHGKVPPSQALQNLTSLPIVQRPNAQETSEMLNPTFNPLAVARRFVPLQDRMRRMPAKQEEVKPEQKQEVESEAQIGEVKSTEEVIEQFQRKNPEFQSKDLSLLREKIKDSDSKEDILRKVLSLYPDFTLADEALDFLLQTTGSELRIAVQGAKNDLNDLYSREIKAGKNISAEALEFAQKGLGSPTELRNMYRDITGNPRDPLTLFEELCSQYAFEQMRTVIFFLLHALGKDLKAKGPSISRAELHRLITEARSLQAILGVYRFFKLRIRMILSTFDRSGLSLPNRVTFEMLAKQFIKLLQERYPSLDKALKLAVELGISEELVAQIIIFTHMRDAVRNVAPRLFRNDQHRQDILTTFMQLIEELDEQLEEEDREEEEKEREKKDKE